MTEKYILAKNLHHYIVLVIKAIRPFILIPIDRNANSLLFMAEFGVLGVLGVPGWLLWVEWGVWGVLGELPDLVADSAFSNMLSLFFGVWNPKTVAVLMWFSSPSNSRKNNIQNK